MLRSDKLNQTGQAILLLLWVNPILLREFTLKERLVEITLLQGAASVVRPMLALELHRAIKR